MYHILTTITQFTNLPYLSSPYTNTVKTPFDINPLTQSYTNTKHKTIIMKLLRSTFLAFYLTSNNNVSAFSSQLSTKSLSSRRTNTVTTPTSLYMSIESLHETPKAQLSEEEILKESMFLQVVREVNMAKEFMDYLIEESGADTEVVAKEEESPAAASSDDIRCHKHLRLESMDICIPLWLHRRSSR